MRVFLLALLAFALSGCATTQVGDPTVSILIDLDPASTERTVIVESITADRSGMLYLPDRVTGNILRVDPKSPKAVVVGKIEAREIEGRESMPILRASRLIPKVIFSLPSGRFVKLCASAVLTSTRRSRDWRKPLRPGPQARMASSLTGKEIFSSQAAPAASSIVSVRMAAQPKQRCKSTSTCARCPTARPSSQLSPTVLSSMPMVRSWSQTRRAAQFGRS